MIDEWPWRHRGQSSLPIVIPQQDRNTRAPGGRRGLGTPAISADRFDGRGVRLYGKFRQHERTDPGDEETGCQVHCRAIIEVSNSDSEQGGNKARP